MMSSRFEILLGRLSVALLATAVFPAGANGSSTTITVSGTQWGVSTQYIGANEGDQYFNINDLKDLGINTYRIYGGMSRWEWQDDDGVFGSPTIAQIKANPSVINWTWWDQAMNANSSTQNGSDYWWSGDSGVWQGSAATIFAALKANNIRPVVVLRNVDNNKNPAWANMQLNPPNTTSGQNEWWEHVFSTAYWLNVRNSYQVDDWEIHNEPNNGNQGWSGTEADYIAFANLTADAIRYVYSTYLPGRTPHIYAPVTTTGSSWPRDLMQQAPTAFDSVDIHDYDGDIRNYVEQVHGYMNSNGFTNAPLWVSEWGTYRSGYKGVTFGVNNVVKNLIYGSYPGNDHVTGSHIFSLYDWGAGGYGLIEAGDTPQADYYAMRLAIRGLQGGRPTYQSTSSNRNVTAITTKDSAGHYWVLLTNTSKTASTTTINLSALLSSGTGTMWVFDGTHNDVIVGNPILAGGNVTVTLSGTSANLIEF